MTPITIPIGPQHHILKEPISFKLDLSGEQVIDASLRIGYVHRGIERLCQQRTYVQNLHIMERVCGICSHAHTSTYCQAVESLLGIELPRRAAYIRSLLCELERIHSHLLWLGILAESIGFTTIFMYSWRDREIILDLMEELSGGRVCHAVNVIGGVRTDVDPRQVQMIRERLEDFEKQVKLFFDLFERDRSFRLRTQGLGILDLETVRALGVVGPNARASGHDVDMRRDAPYAAYPELEFRVVTTTDGDLWCRAYVRVQEILESVRLCERILENLPGGPLSVPATRHVLAGEVVTRSEAPRGELFYYVRSDGTERPARVKLRTPTLPTLMAIGRLLPGVQIADAAPLIASADLCIACADR